ncbi:BatA domain-containing protein [Planctomicrobium sp. SH664]|uniref:BatA domain-containing protein n=1 Tax=Planctomicrobium sp. SH664 TaxID=3448125 RepID=UPI003F5B5A1E
MLFGFFHAAMLLGLAAIGLPILAHLLSKRRFDVVEWGAMRFLQLGQRTRRNIRLQDLLLLLLRIAIVVALVLAVSRPWGQGKLFGSFQSAPPQDVVFILDSSGSMAWTGGPQSPHQAAIQWLHEALETIRPGDTVTVLEARDRPVRTVFPPQNDLPAIRARLSRILPPAGDCQLVPVIAEGLQILSTTLNPQRRVIVLTDRQSLPWTTQEEAHWGRVTELLEQFPTRPAIEVVQLEKPGPRRNLSVGRMQLSRSATVPGFPVTIRSTIRQSGGEPVQQPVTFEINGQQIEHKTTTVHLLPDGEATLAVPYTFATPGDYVVSFSLPADHLPADDRNNAVVQVESGITVLLVNGAPRVDPSRDETFFLASAFAAVDSESPWIQATSVRPAELTAEGLSRTRIVFLCNVAALSRQQGELLRQFVMQGGGLVIAPGDQTEAAEWNQLSLQTLLPASLGEIQSEQQPEGGHGVTVDPLSLQAGWLSPFRQSEAVDFHRARFSKWWELKAQNEGASEEGSRPQILASLSNGAPWLVSRSLGRGSVLQFAVPLDADWSTFPARSDFVPFLHELVFMLTAQSSHRNVDVGAPLVVTVPESVRVGQLSVLGPGLRDRTIDIQTRGELRIATFRDTLLPGLYRIEDRQAGRDFSVPFAVDDDRRESDLRGFGEGTWKDYLQQHGLKEIESMRQALQAETTQRPPVELWWLLILMVLALLVAEAAVTRRMVQGGHLALDAPTET